MIIDFRMTAPLSTFMDPEAAKKTLPTSYMRGYMGKYEEAELMTALTVDHLLEGMEAAGVDKAVLQSEWAFGDYRKQNDAVYKIVQSHPDKFIAGFLAVNPQADDDMVALVEKEVKDRGFKGVNIQSWAYRLKCNDKRFYPVYEICQTLGIVVTIHTSINFTVDRTIDFGRPLWVDEVACDFPELTIVANHGGWPWVNELVAVAWKHPKVFIEIGAVSPKYIGTPGTGWDPLMVYGNSLLQNQVLFATDNMLPQQRCIDELKALPLKEEVKKKWLGENAARILGLR